MAAWLLAIALAGAQAPCPGEQGAFMAEASARAQESDMSGALDLLRKMGASGCIDAVVGLLYLQGLVDARAAYGQGGSDESLEPVRRAISALEKLSQNQPGPAEIVRLMLQAAAAAAQSERDEMMLYLEHAEQMDALLRAAGQPAAPLVTAAEVSGELWLQVHRYDDARRAFMKAAAQVGMTPRVKAGLARIDAAR
jgi:tetratricopeptide (TPR) repeat protein